MHNPSLLPYKSLTFSAYYYYASQLTVIGQSVSVTYIINNSCHLLIDSDSLKSIMPDQFLIIIARFYSHFHMNFAAPILRISRATLKLRVLYLMQVRSNNLLRFHEYYSVLELNLSTLTPPYTAKGCPYILNIGYLTSRGNAC